MNEPVELKLPAPVELLKLPKSPVDELTFTNAPDELDSLKKTDDELKLPNEPEELDSLKKAPVEELKLPNSPVDELKLPNSPVELDSLTNAPDELDSLKKPPVDDGNGSVELSGAGIIKGARVGKVKLAEQETTKPNALSCS